MSLLLFAPFASLAGAQDTPMTVETALIAEARHAAGRNDDAMVVAWLRSDSGLASQASAGVTLARRAMAVCGWLRNENDHGRAMKVAQQAIDQLAHLREPTDADRVERLYWEAMLLAGMLDRKAEALELLQAAEKLAPDDDRVLQCALQLAEALAEFGR